MAPFFDYRIRTGDLDLNGDFADLKILQIFLSDPAIYI